MDQSSGDGQNSKSSYVNSLSKFISISRDSVCFNKKVLYFTIFFIVVFAFGFYFEKVLTSVSKGKITTKSKAAGNAEGEILVDWNTITQENGWYLYYPDDNREGSIQVNMDQGGKFPRATLAVRDVSDNFAPCFGIKPKFDFGGAGPKITFTVVANCRGKSLEFVHNFAMPNYYLNERVEYPNGIQLENRNFDFKYEPLVFPSHYVVTLSVNPSTSDIQFNNKNLYEAEQTSFVPFEPLRQRNIVKTDVEFPSDAGWTNSQKFVMYNGNLANYLNYYPRANRANSMKDFKSYVEATGKTLTTWYNMPAYHTAGDTLDAEFTDPDTFVYMKEGREGAKADEFLPSFCNAQNMLKLPSVINPECAGHTYLIKIENVGLIRFPQFEGRHPFYVNLYYYDKLLDPPAFQWKSTKIESINPFYITLPDRQNLDEDNKYMEIAFTFGGGFELHPSMEK